MKLATMLWCRVTLLILGLVEFGASDFISGTIMWKPNVSSPFKVTCLQTNQREMRERELETETEKEKERDRDRESERETERERVVEQLLLTT